jgi:hypothetical protein
LTLADGGHDGVDPCRTCSIVDVGVVRIRSVRNNPGDIRKIAGLNVGDDLGSCAFEHDMAVPLRAVAGELVRWSRSGRANLLDGIGRSPDRSVESRIILPSQVGLIQQIGQGGMVKALQAVEGGAVVVGERLTGIKETDGGAWWSKASYSGGAVGACVVSWIAGDIERARGSSGARPSRRANCRRSRQDVLVRGETRPLIGLEHIVSERVGLGQW